MIRKKNIMFYIFLGLLLINISSSLAEVRLIEEGEEEEVNPIELLKITRERIKEQDELNPRIKVNNQVYYAKYKVNTWDAEEGLLNVFVMRKRKGKITTYKKEVMLEGKNLNKGLLSVEIAKEFVDDAYTKAKHGKIKKIRIELWYPAYGGAFIEAMEIPKVDEEELKKLAKDEKKVTWWEKIEYGEYY